jgi:hypothetical protein
MRRGKRGHKLEGLNRVEREVGVRIYVHSAWSVLVCMGKQIKGLQRP